MIHDKVVREFVARFGSRPEYLVRAPGRVNLIGEHTDYNDGFVLPMAIDRAVWIALRSRRDRVVQAHSLEFGATAPFDLTGFDRGDTGWLEYVKGTAWALAGVGAELQGWDGVVGGDVPVGAGLSSSAALEVAALRAFSAVAGIPWVPATMAALGQKAENDWVGVRCGIMDQMISAAGVDGHALLIDCRSLDTRPVPLPADVAVVILDTTTRRGLVESAYNERRRQCEAAAAAFGVAALRDVDLSTFRRRADQLDALTAQRARHVVTENARTVEAAAAMEAGDARALGTLMDASHESLRDDFQVSTEALDRMVELARAEPACLGARLTGAGFGGCVVALASAERPEVFAEAVSESFREAMGLTPRWYVSRAHAGATLERVPQ